MAYFDGLNDSAILEMALDDWNSANESRRELAARKLDDYKKYRVWRDDVNHNTGAGPFGWSRMSIPMVFWIAETILPRVGITVPTITARPLTPDAVPYAAAKQLRLQHQWREAQVENELMMGVKSAIIMGDGPLKTSWSGILGGPQVTYINWFDFFVSPEAERMDGAEFVIHRTWHTRRGIEEMMRRDGSRKDPNGGSIPPIYDHEALERVIHGSSRDSSQEEWVDIRAAMGSGTPTWQPDGAPVGLVEIWYADGTMAVIAEDEAPHLIRVEREPLMVDDRNNAFRPFSVLHYSDDLFGPNGISLPDTISDFQAEASTLANQSMDQATRNLNSPIGVDASMVTDKSEVTEAFGTPGGVFMVNGRPREAVERFAPGQVSGDFERMMQNSQQWAQMVSGVSDIAAGIPTPGGLQNNTATGASILRDEANMRYRLLIKMIAMGVDVTARHFHWLDRMNSRSPVVTPLPAGWKAPPGSQGITPLPNMEGWAAIDADGVNGPDARYAIRIEANTLTPDAQGEQAQKVRSMVNDLLAVAPLLPPGSINWGEVVTMLVSAIGEDPERILVAQALNAPPMPMMGPPPGAPPGPGGPPPEAGPPPPPDPGIPPAA